MILTDDVILEGAERDEANAEALALEERASMYSMTTPAKPQG